MVIKRAKRRCFIYVIQFNKNSGTTLWKTVKQTIGQQKDNEIVTKIQKASSIVTTKTNKIAIKFNEHFSGICFQNKIPH